MSSDNCAFWSRVVALMNFVSIAYVNIGMPIQVFEFVNLLYTKGKLLVEMVCNVWSTLYLK